MLHLSRTVLALRPPIIMVHQDRDLVEVAQSLYARANPITEFIILIPVHVHEDTESVENNADGGNLILRRLTV